MGDLRPLGSEKLEGLDKLKRIMEIAKYNDVPKLENNDLSTTNYTIRLADGNLYGIVKEKSGYIIKKGLNESNLDYSEPMRMFMQLPTQSLLLVDQMVHTGHIQLHLLYLLSLKTGGYCHNRCQILTSLSM